MPTMIPATINAQTVSQAERKLFQAFATVEGADDWIILHSIGIADHIDQEMGEADFIVIAPYKGTFVLEVKGGQISHAGGQWYSTDLYDGRHEIKNPVNQAKSAMFSLMKYIEQHQDRKDHLHTTRWGFGVAFPDVTWHNSPSTNPNTTAPDLAEPQICDSDDIHDMQAYIERLTQYWSNKTSFNPPNRTQANAIAELLAPHFDLQLSIGSSMRNFDRELITLTETQQTIFEGLEDNERCLVRGYAGTGKTLLAINLCKNLTASGQTYALFCYNLKLASHLNTQLESSETQVISSLTDYMEGVAKAAHPTLVSQLKKEDPAKFYQETLPHLFLEIWTESGNPPFDYLVLDEAQDLFTPNFLEVLNTLLKGGLKNGHWTFFLDAEKQNIFQQGVDFAGCKELLSGYDSHYANYVLRDNCRNTPSIIESIDQVFGLETRYKNRNEKGAETEYHTYAGSTDQVNQLRSILRILKEDHIPPEHITLLSFLKYENSIVSRLKNYDINQGAQPIPDQIQFATIQGYKGLENHAIIITDIEELENPQKTYKTRLLYVGMTRAKSYLALLLSKPSAKYLCENPGKLLG